MFDDHVVIETNGAWTESFHPGDEAMKHLLPHARAEIAALFPEKQLQERPIAHPAIKGYEARVLQVA